MPPQHSPTGTKRLQPVILMVSVWQSAPAMNTNDRSTNCHGPVAGGLVYVGER
jgi:hypothetical protein